MIWFWIPTSVLIAVVVPWLVVPPIRAVFKRRPRVRTSAMQRLIELNPTLNAAGVRWSVASQRIRIGWMTTLTIAVAVLIATDRPRPIAS